MNDTAPIVLSWTANGRGKPIITASSNGNTLLAERCDLFDRDARTTLAARLFQLTNIPPAETERTLLGFSAELVKIGDRGDGDGEDAKPDDSGKVEYPRITCAELDAAEYRIEYLIDHILVAGQPAIIAGGKKCLKTSLIIDMGISLAMGGFFLGKFKVNRAARVGIMSGESGMSTIQETARRIAHVAGYSLADIGSGLIFTESLPLFGRLDHEDALRQFILNDELEVLFIDPCYLCMPGGDAGNLFAQGELLRGMAEVCRETGTTMILCHHTRKTKIDPFAPPELEDIAWAGFQEFCRQWLLVGRRERYEPGTGDHRLWLSVGGSSGHGGLWAVDVSEGTRDSIDGRYWQVDVLPADEAREQVKSRAEEAKQAEQQRRIDCDKEQLVRIMVKFPEPNSKTAIRDVAGLGHGKRFEQPWLVLLQEGVIVRDGTIKKPNRQTYDAFRLDTEGEP